MWLAKLFNLRDKASRSRGTMTEDEEKPFLAHLEDLRTMVVRVVATLLISTIVCFTFSAQLLDLIMGPAKKAGVVSEVSLPKTVSYDNWETIRKLNRAAVPLSAEQRSMLMDAAFADPEKWGEDADLKELRQIADVHYIYLASEQLGEEARQDFLNRALGGDPELLSQAERLFEAGTPADLDGNVSAITMQALGVTETFKLTIKLSLYAGIVIGFPLLFYFVAQFVFPGLTPREKKLLWPSLTVGFGLFIVGVVFAYFFVTVEALKFFHGFSKSRGIEDQWKIGEYVAFATQLILIFGLSFELPVVVMALVKLDLLSHEFMRETRSYAIIIILVVAAIITPTPDAIVLTALAGPMIVLYEICIWLSWFMKRKERKKEEEEEAARRKRRSVTPAVGALPVSDSNIEAENSSGADSRPYDQADDAAHDPYHDAAHDPYHDEHHGDGTVDYDPYHDGYYDEYYRDAAEAGEGEGGSSNDHGSPSDSVVVEQTGDQSAGDDASATSDESESVEEGSDQSMSAEEGNEPPAENYEDKSGSE